MDRRTAPEHYRIDRPQTHGERDDEVAFVEIQSAENTKVPASDDPEQTSQRDGGTYDLAHRRAVTHENRAEKQNEGRLARLQQHGVERCGQLQSAVEQGVEGADAECAKHQQHPPVPSDDGCIPTQVTPCEWQDDGQGNRPSPERQGDGRDQLSRRARNDRITGPKQGGEREEHVSARPQACKEAGLVLHDRPERNAAVEN